MRSRSVGRYRTKKSVSFKRSSSRARSTSRRRSTKSSRKKSAIRFEKKVRKIVTKRAVALDTFVKTNSYQLTTIPDTTTSTGVTGRQIMYPLDIVGVGTLNDLFTTGSFNASKITIHSYSSEVLINNRTSAPIILKLYECIARRDVPSSTLYDLLTLMNDSLSHQSSTPSGFVAPSINSLGYSPYSNRGLTKNFKIIKQRTRTLMPGGLTKYTVSLKRCCDIDQIVDSYSNIMAKKGVTKCLVIQAYGTPTNDEKTSTLLSTEKVTLDVMKITRINWNYISDTSFTSTVKNQPTASVIGQEMSIVSTVQPFAEA